MQKHDIIIIKKGTEREVKIMDKSRLMKRAWTYARECTGNIRARLSYGLKKAWEETKYYADCQFPLIVFSRSQVNVLYAAMKNGLIDLGSRSFKTLYDISELEYEDKEEVSGVWEMSRCIENCVKAIFNKDEKHIKQFVNELRNAL